MNYTLRYKKAAMDSGYGWEHQSMPVGNGWLGANVFGIVHRDRIQITENSLQNPGELGGLNNFAELYLHFDHGRVGEYERGLNLNDAIAYTTYRADGICYRREYFASYPDRALVIRLTADGPFAFRTELKVPYVKSYAKQPGDGGGKNGTVSYEGNRGHLQGCMEYYNVRFVGELALVTDGEVVSDEKGLRTEKATEAVIYLTVGTNYELRPEVFLQENPKKKLRDVDPAAHAQKLLSDALEKGYNTVRRRHLEDYRALFGRVELDLGKEETAPTDRLLRAYSLGRKSSYLEGLYFQFGRYLLIASSRKGTLPANLQGVWNVHDQSPWGSGYWHNINVQMNYWPAFSTNLAETFSAYAAFNEAFRPAAEKAAETYIWENMPENFTDGRCGWTVGTGIYPYAIEGPGGHSGPGTGGLTTKLFWDYYDFTRDPEILRTVSYPALRGMSEFLTKTVCLDEDGLYRAKFSASPEQMRNKQYYHTRGCTFDQQMIWENGRDFIAAAECLGLTDDPVYRRQKQQQDRYCPVRIGGSGQIKEFEEEDLYGQIGEFTHRHISQLVGLYPGTAIGFKTPAWLDAAKITLTKRGDRTTGWALAHRLNAWARLGDGQHAYRILRRLLGKRTMENLWDLHPPFQIDGNFGGTAGIAEMLLQSNGEHINILPALPKAWKNGSVSGLVARGAFEVDIDWRNGAAKKITVRSQKGGRCAVCYPCIEEAEVYGGRVLNRRQDQILLDTQAGDEITFTGIPWKAASPAPKVIIRLGKRLLFVKRADCTYQLYRAESGRGDYVRLPAAPQKLEQGLYKLTAQRVGCRESAGAIFYIPERPESMGYRLRTLWMKLYGIGFYACCEMDRILKNLRRR